MCAPEVKKILPIARAVLMAAHGFAVHLGPTCYEPDLRLRESLPGPTRCVHGGASVAPDAIAHALDTILREPRLAAQIAAYGRRRAADFSADALAATYADLYRQFLPAGNVPEKA